MHANNAFTVTTEDAFVVALLARHLAEYLSATVAAGDFDAAQDATANAYARCAATEPTTRAGALLKLDAITDAHVDHSECAIDGYDVKIDAFVETIAVARIALATGADGCAAELRKASRIYASWGRPSAEAAAHLDAAIAALARPRAAAWLAVAPSNVVALRA